MHDPNWQPDPDDRSPEAKGRRFVNLVDQAIAAGAVRRRAKPPVDETGETDDQHKGPNADS